MELYKITERKHETIFTVRSNISQMFDLFYYFLCLDKFYSGLSNINWITLFFRLHQSLLLIENQGIWLMNSKGKLKALLLWDKYFV